MLILAIDTTGFSASIALVKNGKKILFNKNSSGYLPVKKWEEFPYILPVHHQEFLLKNLERILKKHNIKWENIDAIAVSANSGIYTCILVGVSIAYTLGKIYKKPVIDVDHILAHNYSTWLEENPGKFQFPILIFSASGSHSDFALLKDINKFESLCSDIAIKDIGGVQTFIGIGKIFREIGKSLKIIKPSDKTAGVSIGKTIKAMSKGNAFKFDFVSYYQGELLDLNFSNFMDSIDIFLEQNRKKTGSLHSRFINDVAASFQESITEILFNKIIKIAEIKKAKEIHIVGGISENKYLEKKLKERISAKGGSASGGKKEKLPFILRYPVKKEYRLDNAAMIGCLAYYQQKYKIKFKNFKPNITK